MLRGCLYLRAACIHELPIKGSSRKLREFETLGFARLLRRAGPMPCKKLGCLVPSGPRLYTGLPTSCFSETQA